MRDTEKKFIALRASSFKSSTIESSGSDSSDGDESLDEDLGLFVRKYNRYLRKNEIRHLDKNLIDYRRKAKPNKPFESKRDHSKGSCYNCGKLGLYKPYCPLFKKDKVRNKFQKKPNKARRACIA